MKIDIPTTLKHDLLTFWLIATTSMCIGIFYNQFRQQPLTRVYQTKEERLSITIGKILTGQDLPKNISSLPMATISQPEFKKFIQEKRGPILDVRAEELYREGHILGAISLPYEDFENAYNQLQEHLQPLDLPIVLYCSGPACTDSTLVQKALVALGYTKTAVFKGGWAERNGLPQEK